MKSPSSRLVRIWSVAALLLAIAAPSVFGQAAFFDFNTPGQLTNNFGVRGKTAGQGAVWFETATNGVAGSGALDGNASGNFTTLTYLGDDLPFPLNDGATINMSVMYRGKTSGQAGAVAQVILGLIGYSNNVAILTNNFMEGNSVVNWLNFRTRIASASTNLDFEYGIFMTTNSGNIFSTSYQEYSNRVSGAIGVVNATFTNWYKLSATFIRTNVKDFIVSGSLDSWGGLGTAFQSNVLTLTPNVVTGRIAFNTSVRPALEALENTGVDYIDNFSFNMTNGAAIVTAPPVSQSISTYRTATFVAKADGTPPFAYTWYTNGVAAGGSATNATYTTPLMTSADTISIYVAVTNALGGADSSATPATLTITADATAPNVVSVGSVDGLTIGVAFDEPVSAAAAIPGNYSVTGGTVTSATIRPDGRVALTLSSAITGNFTVTVSGVTDLAGNPLSVNSANGTVLGLTPTDVGSPLTSGSSFSSSPGDIDQLGGGLDFFNFGDQGHFAGGTRTGDFDIRVRVESLTRARPFTIFTGRDDVAQAGIVAKESFDAGSRMVRTYTSPIDSGMPIGANTIGNSIRTAPVTAAANISTAVAKPAYAANGYFPNMWLRLRRVNNTFTTYYSTNANGSNWIAYGTNTAVMTPNMVVGPATSPRVDDYNSSAQAQYRSYGDWSVTGATLAFAVNLAATNTINLTWPTTNATTTLTVTATNLGTIFPSNEINFVWQRNDGFGNFTNIPNAAAQPSSTPFTNSAVGSYTTPALHQGDNGAQFRVIARGPGGLSITSSVNTVIVNFIDTAAPTVTSAWIPYLGSNALALTFNVPLDITTVSNLANYTITNQLGQVVTITGVILEQGGLTASGITRVILLTSVPLTNALYNVVFNNGLRGTNSTPIALNSVRQVGYGTVKVELWPNTGAGTTITNDFLANAKILTNVADFTFFTNIFSFGHNGAAFADSLNTYGGRISAWFIAPSNGTYRFFIRNDDGGQLYFNPNGPDPAGKVLAAFQAGANANYGNTLGVNMSAGYTLVSNEAYYIEGIWKENNGGDGFGLMFREAAVATTPAVNEFADGRFFAPLPLTVPVNHLHTLVSFTNTYPSAFNIGQPGLMGPARVEFFTASGSGSIATFTNSAKFLANTPDLTIWTNVFGFSTNQTDTTTLGNNYGARLSAYFVAPSNGFYRFYVKADDNATFAINTNGTLPSGKVVLASLGAARNSYASNDTSVTVPISLTNGQWYYIEGLYAEGAGGDGFALTWRYFPDFNTATNSVIIPGTGECMDYRPLRPIPVTATTQLAYQSPIQADLFTGFGGTAITDLTGNAKFLAAMPDLTYRMAYFGFNRDLVNSPVPSDNYGARVSAYFVAPSNGFFRFYIRGDDGTQLFMSTNNATSTDYTARTLIARADGAGATYTNGTGGSESPIIGMNAGQRYFVEALLKEATGGDGVSITFRGFATTNATAEGANALLGTRTAGISNAESISSTFFAPVYGPVTANNIVQSPTGTVFNDGQVINFSVANVTGAMPIGFQWRKNGINILGANANSLNVTLTPADVGINTYSVVIYNPQSSTERSINLTATAINLDTAPPIITSVVGNGLQNEVTVVFSENMLPATATNIANYSIDGLVITAAYLRAANQVALLTSAQTPGARYTLAVSNVRDTSRLANVIESPSYFDFTAWNYQRGFVTADIFTGLNNNTFPSALYAEPKFIFNTPDQTQYRPSFGFGSVGGGTDFADNYGARLYGWFIAPSNGTYRFFIRSDDQSQLFMNTNTVNSTDPAGKTPIGGSTLTCCGAYNDLSRGPVISPVITLTANQLYYMEAIFKEGGGGDGVAVAFRAANDPSIPPNTEVIPGYYFASLGNPDLTTSFNITNQPVSQTLAAGQPVVLRVGARPFPVQVVNYQWQLFNGGVWTDINAATNFLGTNAVYSTAFSVAGTYQFRALASVPGILRTSDVATITVTNVPSGGGTAPVLLWASVSTNGTTVTAQYNEPVTEVTATNGANYLLTNHIGDVYSVTVGSLLADNRTVVLTVTPALTPGNATNYTLIAANIVDVGDSLTGGGQWTFWMPGGSMRYDIYAGLTGGVVPAPFPSYLPNLSGSLTTNLFITSSFFTTTNGTVNFMENYAGRVSGYIIPPSNGLYRFFIASDDGSQLWLNTNGASSTGRVLIASAPSANLGYLSAGNLTTVSPWITLNAGQRYFMESLWKEGTGGDYVSVAVREANDSSIPVYAAANGSAIPSLWFGAPDSLVIVPTASTFDEGATNAVLGTVIGAPAFIQWYSNSIAIPGATNATFALPNPLGTNLNGVAFQVIATNFVTAAASNQFIVTVNTDVTAPTLVSVTRDSTWTNLVLTFSEFILLDSATNLANYLVWDGTQLISLSNAVLRPDGRSVSLSIGLSNALDPATVYYVTNNNIADRASGTNLIAANTVGSAPALTLATGFVAVDLYTGPNSVTALTADSRFIANTPTLQMTLGSFDWRTTNFPFVGLQNYALKAYGWFMPPSNGLYRFYGRGDDNFLLNMNTNGAAPSGKSQVVTVGCCGILGTSPSISLTSGTPYYVEVLFSQAGGQEYFSLDFRDAAAGTPPNASGNGFNTSGYWAGSEVAAGIYFGVYGDPGLAAPAFSTQPVSTNALPGQLVNLTALVTNVPMGGYVFYQWQMFNGTSWTNAGPLENFLADYAMLGNRSNFTTAVYYTTDVRCVATLAGGVTVTSATATITVPDEVNLISAGSLGGTNVVLTFNKPLKPDSGGEPSNYFINGEPGTVLTAAIQPDGRTVWLRFAFPLTSISGPFTVTASDIYESQNNFGYSGTVAGTVLAADFNNDLGNNPGVTDPVLRGSAISLTNAGLDVVAGGGDFWTTSDRGYYVARQITGNFDIRARVASMTNQYQGISDANAKAGFMARLSTNHTDRMISLIVAPPALSGWPTAVGANNWQFLFRDTVGVNAANVSAGTAWPAPDITPWVRFVRSGSVIAGYRSYDGTNWTLVSARDTAVNGGAYPDSIFVGLATCSHNNNTNPLPSLVSAQYRDIYFPATPSITSQPIGSTNGLGANITLSVTASNPANSGALIYQWRRNGTNLIGAIAASYNIPNASVADSGAYTVLVGNDGGGVFSAVASILITNGAPTVATENLVIVQNANTNIAPGTLLGNNIDPEGQGLSIVAVSGIAPVTFYADFESGLPAATTLYGTAHVTNGFGFTNSNALVLTDAANNQNGSWVISNLVAGRSVSAFRAGFKFRVGDAVGGGADGFSFNLGNDIVAGAASEEGSGTGLSICVDNYDNAGLEAPAIDIKWRGAIIGHASINKLNSADWQNMLVNLDADGTIDITLSNSVIYSNFQTPYAPISNARFGFYARTGGAASTHWFDEVSITVLTPETALSPFTSFSYSSDFNYGLPAGMTLYGATTNAYWTNQTGVDNSGALHLNDAVNSASGAAVIDEITPLKPVSSFTASFKLRILGTAEPADGMSFNFANDLPNAVSGGAEEGVGTGLSFCIRNYRFPDGSVANRSGFKLKWRGVTFAQVQTPTWANANFIPVIMTVNPNGTITVNVNGTNAFNNVPSPFQAMRGRFGFYARTGGQNESHWVDDLNISLPDFGYVTLAGSNVLYVPPRNACGTDSFYYQVSDTQGALVWDSASVTIQDVTAPTILACATNRVIFADSGCQSTLPDLTVNSGLAAFDTCSLTLTQSPPAGTIIGLGFTPVTIYAVDGAGLISTCTAYVTNVDNTIPSITCPANVLVNADPGVCFATGVALGAPLTSDNCSLAAVTNNAPAQFPIGVTIVTWTAVDGSGNTNACTQSVTVTDNQPPSITCPANIVTNLSPGICVVSLNLGTPLASDNCSLATVTNNAPAQFPLGTTIVTWTAVDANGLTNACTQTITVNEAALTIDTQPVGTNVIVGTAVTFNVSVASCSTPYYQWYLGALPITDATNATFSLAAATSCDAGDYTVVITNSVNSVTSTIATLIVTNAPTLIAPGGSLVTTNQAECNNLILLGGSVYNWELSNAAGVAGTNWDLVTVTGGIDVLATSGNPFTINLISLNGGATGPAANWSNDTTNLFTIATATDGVTNFAANKFTLNDSAFSNDLAGGVFSIEEGSLKLRFTPNHAPVANNATYNRAPNLAYKIRITNLLALAGSDVDGDGLILTEVGASTNGATITTNGSYIFFSSTNNLAESFSFTLRDNRGYRAGDTVRTATALLTLTAEAPTGTNHNVLNISATNGVVGLRFAGIPGYTYQIQRATTLVSPTWTTLWTTNCPPLGLFDFIDEAPPVGEAYYRTAQP
jgi:hypothetical protein